MCDIWSVYFSETVILPVLKPVVRKRLVETVEDTSLCVSELYTVLTSLECVSGQ
jgi:hypothetical protein